MRKTSLPYRLATGVLSIALATSALPGAALAEDLTEPQLFINTDGAIEGDVTVDDSAYAVMVSGRAEDAQASAVVTGDVTNATEMGKNIYGAVSQGRDGGSGELTIKGDVTTAPTVEDQASTKPRGIFVSADGGTASMEVSGDVYAYGLQEITGAEVASSGDATSKAIALIEGNVTTESIQLPAVGSNRTYAVQAQSAGQSSTQVKVTGDVTSRTEGPDIAVATGVNIYADEASSTTVEVEGDISTSSTVGAWGASVYANGAHAQLSVGGDVITDAPTEGVGVSLSSNKGGTTELLVRGTVRGSTAGLQLSGDKDASFDITVWKIETNEGGTLVEGGDGSAKDLPEAVAPTIKYLIKVEQPQTGGTLVARDALQAALAQSHGLDVAHAGDKVYLNITLDEGYYVSGAFNGLGDRVELLEDEGGYYVIVPEGGGVYLTAELAKAEPPAPKPKPEPMPEPIPEPTPEPETPSHTVPERAGVADEAIAQPKAAARVLPATSDEQAPLTTAAGAMALAGCACLFFARRRMTR